MGRCLGSCHDSRFQLGTVSRSGVPARVADGADHRQRVGVLGMALVRAALSVAAPVSRRAWGLVVNDIAEHVEMQLKAHGVTVYQVTDGQVFAFTAEFLERILSEARKSGTDKALVFVKRGDVS